jgi:hypothetical protein
MEVLHGFSYSLQAYDCTNTLKVVTHCFPLLPSVNKYKQHSPLTIYDPSHRNSAEQSITQMSVWMTGRKLKW